MVYSKVWDIYIVHQAWLLVLRVLWHLLTTGHCVITEWR